MSHKRHKKTIGKTYEVLIEGFSKKSKAQLQGRNSESKVVVFDAGDHKKGEYVQVKIHDCTTGTLFGTLVEN